MALSSCNRNRSTADLIIENAVIYTADSGFTIYTAMAVAKGRVLALGDDRYIRENFEADSVFDAGGKAIYPGFIDAHCHFYGYSLIKQYADLSYASSFQQVLDILENHYSEYPSAWLAGRGWDQNNWPGRSFPDNTALNRIFPDVPVVLVRVDGHAVLVNDAAIAASGITPDSISDPGMAHMKNGKFSGIFLESYADRFREMIPEPSAGEKSVLLKE
ncbi:MAG TPA: amidohydrolase family protein, partial [Lentimicrobium sp.]|nr:amidohydrolase family protein [Lentimicrobium sp.]